jgi:L-aminopeptidase/D-esterase-like protein
MLTNRNTTLTPQTTFSGRTLTFDFPAVQIGVAEYAEGPTGCTVFYFSHGAATAIDKRGGACGTTGDYSLNHAIVFAGGSLYGLEAAAGVTAELNARHDYRLDRMALVSGAIIWDWKGERASANRIYPDLALGRAALLAAQRGVFPLGARGAGRHAGCGGIFGRERAEKTGQGGAFRQIGATRIAAFIVVNAAGVMLDRQGRVVRGNRDPQSGERRHPVAEYEARIASGQTIEPPTGNTTLTIIITNQQLTRRELEQWGKQVHTSIGRAVQPFQTLTDGDIVFAVTTSEVSNPMLDAATLGVVTGELVWDAILTIPEDPV